MANVKINNVAYSWALVELTSPELTGSANANPIVLSGVTGIKWNKIQHVQENYGIGGESTTRGFGNIECTASITMDYNTQVQLRALRGSLRNIGQFDLIISFSNELGTDDFSTETVTLKGCFFNEDGMEVGQDDMNITKEFDLHPYRIEPSSEANV